MIAICIAAATLGASVDSATLEVSLAADEAYQQCQRALDEKRVAQARNCWQRLIAEHEGTTASLRARAALDVARHAEAPTSALMRARGRAFMPGHLALSTSQATFGIYTGALAAMALGATPGADRAAFTLGGGAAAVGLGLAFGVGTFLVADNQEFSPGDALLWRSATAWGVLFGLNLAPWWFALQGSPWPEAIFPPFDDAFQAALPAVMLPSVVLGGAGLVAGFTIARATALSAGQMSTINTGGLAGVAIALASSPLIGLLGVTDPFLVGLVYLLGGSAGLAAGVLAQQVLVLDHHEVWLIDAATFGAFLAVGGAGFFVRSTAGPDPVRDASFGVATILVTGGALLGVTGLVAQARDARGDVVWRE